MIVDDSYNNLINDLSGRLRLALFALLVLCVSGVQLIEWSPVKNSDVKSNLIQKTQTLVGRAKTIENLSIELVTQIESEQGLLTQAIEIFVPGIVHRDTSVFLQQFENSRASIFSQDLCVLSDISKTKVNGFYSVVENCKTKLDTLARYHELKSQLLDMLGNQKQSAQRWVELFSKQHPQTELRQLTYQLASEIYALNYDYVIVTEDLEGLTLLGENTQINQFIGKIKQSLQHKKKQDNEKGGVDISGLKIKKEFAAPALILGTLLVQLYIISLSVELHRALQPGLQIQNGFIAFHTNFYSRSLLALWLISPAILLFLVQAEMSDWTGNVWMILALCYYWFCMIPIRTFAKIRRFKIEQDSKEGIYGPL